ncbi:MAG: hypothetical protein QOJ94_1007 [Sphingomonadales bacterium]|jgi:hypothetical protein|nr:hypothetical protein [Sphingomonadales bacterium]
MADEAALAVFARSDPEVRKLAGELIDRLSAEPATRVEPKGGSLHLCRRSAFAGLHPRKSALLANLRTAAPIESDRIRKAERVSANRFHNELLIEPRKGLDDELLGWFAQAAALAE